MKILVVCRKKLEVSPFISEQINSVKDKGIDTRCFCIKGKGILAYIKSFPHFIKQIRSFKPDIIHAHYGLSALFANLQRSVPVITTFHGSDINLGEILLFSKISAKLSLHNIYVSEIIAHKAKAQNNYTIQPCGVDLDTFYPVEKKYAREKLKLNPDQKLIVFSSSFDNKIKNVALARSAIEKIDKNILLIELKGYTRQEVNLFLNACDAALITSFMEGSSQFVKEAMACNCPIVSTDVGDVRQNIKNIEGCHVTSFEPEDIAKKLEMAINFGKISKGRERIIELGLDNQTVSKNLIAIYEKMIN